MVPARNATTSAANTMRFARAAARKRQAEHEVEEEGCEQQAPAHQRHFVGRRERGHDDRADAEHGRHEADAELIPAIVKTLRGEQQHDEDAGNVHAEAHHVRDARMLGGKHEVIEDGEADYRAGRDDDGDAAPDLEPRAMLGAEFGFERFVETEKTETLREQARCVRCAWRRIFRGRHTSCRVPEGETALYVFGSRGASRARVSPRSGLIPCGDLGVGVFTRVRHTSSGLHACLRAGATLSRAGGEIPSSFAAVATANSSRCCSV